MKDPVQVNILEGVNLLDKYVRLHQLLELQYIYNTGFLSFLPPQ